MKTFVLPGTDLTVPAVVTGVMRIQEKSDAEVRALFDASLAAGINFFDHADIYGSPVHGCERRFARQFACRRIERSRHGEDDGLFGERRGWELLIPRGDDMLQIASRGLDRRNLLHFRRRAPR